MKNLQGIYWSGAYRVFIYLPDTPHVTGCDPNIDTLRGYIRGGVILPSLFFMDAALD